MSSTPHPLHCNFVRPAPAVKPAVKESLGEQFLQALAAEERWAEAAALCPRVLKVSWLQLLG